MTTSIARICDPRILNLEDSIREAKAAARGSNRFETNLLRFLQIQGMEVCVNFPVVFRGLEVLGEIAEERRLVPVLRPFLRMGDPRIASKTVLIAGRRSDELRWLLKAVNEMDDRARANLIESLWRREDPGVEEIFRSSLKDRNQRVAANAVYGLHLRNSELYPDGLRRLYQSNDPLFRRSAIWVIRSVEGVDGIGTLKPFILDPNSEVRHAAFQALVSLRESKERQITVPEFAEPAINLQGDY